MNEMDDPISARLRTYGAGTVNSFASRPVAASVAQSESGTSAQPMSDAEKGVVNKAAEKLSKLTGTEKLEGFSLKAFFSDVFSKHTEEEIENAFTIGTSSTTPPIASVDASWPRPWLFFRLFVASAILYVLFRMGYAQFQNSNLIPGLILTGVVAIPLSVVVLFIEANVRKNVSLYQVLKAFFLGGIVSLLISLVMFKVTSAAQLDWMGASVAGLAEEPGKLAALLLVVRSPRFRYKLNGLLFGAAVGAGFAVFESMGYAFNSGSYDGIVDSIFVRGVLSPFGHIVWTAICGAAIWRVKGARPFAWSMLGDGRFLRLAAVSVVSHIIWNSPLNLPFYGKYILIGLVCWTIVFALIQEGLKEIRAEKGTPNVR